MTSAVLSPSRTSATSRNDERRRPEIMSMIPPTNEADGFLDSLDEGPPMLGSSSPRQIANQPGGGFESTAT